MMKSSLFTALFASIILLGACSSPGTRPSAAVGRSAAVSSGQAPAVIAEESGIVSKGVIPSTAAPLKVALLVPLSGESVAVGNAMMDAATMAIYDSYVGTPSSEIQSKIILLPKDTGNTPADSVRAAKQAIDQGAKFIIGPLFSQSVTAIAPMAKEAGVTMLTFSNNKAVAEPNVYTFGFMPEQQVERIAEYAYLHGMLRVAVLAPNDPYGQKIQETLMNEYGKRGGLVAPSELYAPSSANIDAAVSRLAAAYSNAGEERRFQAIFVADGGYQLKNIIASLKKTNIDMTKVKLLGTGLWDDPELAKIPEMRGAWFPSALPGPYEKFDRHFTAMYGYKPVRLASLAYDAVTLTTQLAISSSNGMVDPAALVDPKGYTSPANGLFRLRPDGTSERMLSLMEVTPAGFKVIDMAPSSFDK